MPGKKNLVKLYKIKLGGRIRRGGGRAIHCNLFLRGKKKGFSFLSLTHGSGGKII